MTVRQLLAGQPVVPILDLVRPSDMVQVANLLVDAGLPVLEVVLRSPAAADGIRAILSEVAGAVVGAGTVTRPGSYETAIDSGAAFVVTPGLTSSLASVLATATVPVIVGVSTVSEALRALEGGFDTLKIFPVEPLGGPAYVGHLASVLGAASLIPTGGVTVDTAPSYLAHPSVIAVGGTWLCRRSSVDRNDWSGIAAAATRATRLAGSSQS